MLKGRPAKPDPQFGVAWFYPNEYAVGMAGLGYQLVWSLLDRHEESAVFRGFTDCQEAGVQSAELFGFTLSWELDYINIIKALEKNSVPALSESRNDSHPLVFGGGPVLTANPEPFAGIFDIVLLGDAEAVVPVLLDNWKEIRRLRTRQEKLVSLSNLPGIYVPALYDYEIDSETSQIKSIAPIMAGVPDKCAKQIFSGPPDYVTHSTMLSPDTTWGDMFLIEIVRSCPQECRFCLASFLTRPFRATKVDAIIDAIDLGLKHTKKIGLLGPSVTEHPQFDAIASALKERPQIDISIASVRADSLNEHILSALKLLGQKSVTIAIESGSERLRSIMKKNLSEAEILRAVELIDAAGLDGVKFYGIVGLPHETQEDLEETIRLMRQLKKKHRRLKFVFGVSSFVPKAQTPFQWAGRDRNCKKKLEYIRKNLAPLGIDVRPESHNWSDIQTLLSRGDRRLTATLMDVAHNGGNLGAWRKATRNMRNPTFDFYVHRDIGEDEILPWSHLVDQSRSQYLSKHHLEAANAAI